MFKVINSAVTVNDVKPSVLRQFGSHIRNCAGLVRLTWKMMLHMKKTVMRSGLLDEDIGPTCPVQVGLLVFKPLNIAVSSSS